MLRTISCVSTSATDRPRNTSAPRSASASVSTSRSVANWALAALRFVAAGRNDALAVAHDQIFGADAQRHVKLGARDGGRAGPVDDHLHAVDLLAGDLERVEQRGGRDDRRAVLVVVHDRDRRAPLSRPLLDLETFGSLDVLEVDAAEGDRMFLTVSMNWSVSFVSTSMSNTSMSANVLNKKPLPSMTGLPAIAPMSPSPKHGRAVRDDGDQVAFGRIFVGVVADFSRFRGTAPPRRASRPAKSLSAVLYGLVGTTSILPGRPSEW